MSLAWFGNLMKTPSEKWLADRSIDELLKFESVLGFVAPHGDRKDASPLEQKFTKRYRQVRDEIVRRGVRTIDRMDAMDKLTTS